MSRNFALVLIGLWTGMAVAAESPMKRFHRAVFSGDLETTKRLVLDEKVDIRGNSEEQVPPGLIVAAAYGHYKVAEFLLAQGADPNEPHYPSKMVPKSVRTMALPLNQAISNLLHVFNGIDLVVRTDPSFATKREELRATIDLLVDAGAKLDGVDCHGVASELLVRMQRAEAASANR